MDFDNDIDLLTASELLELTADPEVIYQKAKKNITQNLMDTMVKKAKYEGKTVYTATFMKDAADRLVPELKTEFETLGFIVTSNDTNDNKQVDLTLDWSK